MTDDLNLPPHGKPAPRRANRRDQPAELLACLACGQLTHRATLSLFGARCVSCYEAWCRFEDRRPA